jgi:hypothetical protein
MELPLLSMFRLAKNIIFFLQKNEAILLDAEELKDRIS